MRTAVAGRVIEVTRGYVVWAVRGIQWLSRPCCFQEQAVSGATTRKDQCMTHKAFHVDSRRLTLLGTLRHRRAHLHT